MSFQALYFFVFLLRAAYRRRAQHRNGFRLVRVPFFFRWPSSLGVQIDEDCEAGVVRLENVHPELVIFLLWPK